MHQQMLLLRRLALVLLLQIIGTSRQSERILRGNFNMRFMCGTYLGATGRLQLKFIAKTLITLKESIVFDTVLERKHNGYFIKNVTAKMDVMQALNTHEFQLKFRTNCFILNKNGECCANDFIFYGRTITGQDGNLIDHKWFDSNFSLKNTPRKKCRHTTGIASRTTDCKYSRLHATNCHFYMNLLNPKAPNGGPHKNTVDLVDLLIHMNNASVYGNFFLQDVHNPWLKVGPWLKVRRVCAPKNNEMTDEGNGEMWPICDPIRYGLPHKLADTDEQKLLEKIDLSADCPHGTRSGCEPCDQSERGN